MRCNNIAFQHIERLDLIWQIKQFTNLVTGPKFRQIAKDYSSPPKTIYSPGSSKETRGNF